MKTIYSVAVSAALIVFCVSIGQAASKPNDISQAMQARGMLEQIDSWSASVADTADELAAKTKGNPDPESPLDRLNTLKEEVNKIGRDLQLLEAERGSLTEWENQAVGQVLPLMELITAYTTGAIEMYASDQSHLWATPFPEYTARISRDAERVKELLDGHLKLATARDKEQRIESEVESTR